jgi:phosphoribosyl 1,2-cyclic phosphate phosphodiesterase
MKITFLGTGTSTGIPQIGCDCETCTSPDPKDIRLRASVLIEESNTGILIDSGPDMRQQLLQHKIRHISGLLITHEHYDHLGGLDDVRPLGEVNVYAEKKVSNVIRHNMSYCFTDNKYPGVPAIRLHEIDLQPFLVENLRIIPVRVMHARLPILGFRIGKMAYLTDVKTIHDEELNKLHGLDVLILNALRIKPHISHLSLSEAVELAQKIGAKRTYFTHFSHHLGKHDHAQAIIPDNMYIAYDDLVVEI